MRGQLAEGGRRIAADGSGPRRTAGDQACHRASHHAARLQESSCGESQRVLEQLGSPARDTPLAQEQRRGEGFSGAVVHDSPADKRVVATIPCERVRITSAVSLCAVALLCVGTLPIGLSATCWGTAPRGASPRTGARRRTCARSPWRRVRRLAGVARQQDPGQVLPLSLAPSATAVLDPAKSCLPSPPSVNGSMPHLQSSYFVDIILVDIERPLDVIVAGREIGREPCCGEPPLGPSACLSGLALLGNAFDGSVLPPAHVSSLYRHKFRPGDLNQRSSWVHHLPVYPWIFGGLCGLLPWRRRQPSGGAARAEAVFSD